MASKPARYSGLYLVAGVALVVADSAARGKAPHAATLALSTAWLLASTMGVVAGYRRLWALREVRCQQIISMELPQALCTPHHGKPSRLASTSPRM